MIFGLRNVKIMRPSSTTLRKPQQNSTLQSDNGANRTQYISTVIRSKKKVLLSIFMMMILGTTKLRIMSAITLNIIILSLIMLNIIFNVCGFAECYYFECHYAVYLNIECNCAEIDCCIEFRYEYDYVSLCI